MVRECQWEVERRTRVRPDVIATMQALHSEVKGKFETAWGMTDEVPMEEGLGQGCVAAPVRSKLMLSVMQRAVRTLCKGYTFTGAKGGTPLLFYADDATRVVALKL